MHHMRRILSPQTVPGHIFQPADFHIPCQKRSGGYRPVYYPLFFQGTAINLTYFGIWTGFRFTTTGNNRRKCGRCLPAPRLCPSSDTRRTCACDSSTFYLRPAVLRHSSHFLCRWPSLPMSRGNAGRSSRTRTTWQHAAEKVTIKFTVSYGSET